MNDDSAAVLEAEALRYHSRGQPRRVALAATKPMAGQRDLVQAYSPGVAGPVRRIAEDPVRPTNSPLGETMLPSSPTAPRSLDSAASVRWPPSR